MISKSITLYEIKYGDLFFGEHHIARSNEAFGVVLLNDGSFSFILKHGSLKRTREYLKQAQSRGQIPGMEHELLILPVNQLVVNEINQCIENSTRSEKLKGNLMKIAKENPELKIPEFYDLST